MSSKRWDTKLVEGCVNVFSIFGILLFVALGIGFVWWIITAVVEFIQVFQ